MANLPSRVRRASNRSYPHPCTRIDPLACLQNEDEEDQRADSGTNPSLIVAFTRFACMARASAKDEDDGEEEEEEEDDDAPKSKKRKVAVDKEDKPKLTVKTKSGTYFCARCLAARTCDRARAHSSMFMLSALEFESATNFLDDLHTGKVAPKDIKKAQAKAMTQAKFLQNAEPLKVSLLLRSPTGQIDELHCFGLLADQNFRQRAGGCTPLVLERQHGLVRHTHAHTRTHTHAHTRARARTHTHTPHARSHARPHTGISEVRSRSTWVAKPCGRKWD